MTLELKLPEWTVASERRRAHIQRVTQLIDGWAQAMKLPARERQDWHDAALWHDTLHDAPEDLLRTLTGNTDLPFKMLHGPAAAIKLAADGETRQTVLDAIRWHTVGHIEWDRTGRALYMADFLEPERGFAKEDRAYLARQVPIDFDGTFRQVVRMRLSWTLTEGKSLFPESVALWNHVR